MPIYHWININTLYTRKNNEFPLNPAWVHLKLFRKYHVSIQHVLYLKINLLWHLNALQWESFTIFNEAHRTICKRKVFILCECEPNIYFWSRNLRSTEFIRKAEVLLNNTKIPIFVYDFCFREKNQIITMESL